MIKQGFINIIEKLRSPRARRFTNLIVWIIAIIAIASSLIFRTLRMSEEPQITSFEEAMAFQGGGTYLTLVDDSLMLERYLDTSCVYLVKPKGIIEPSGYWQIQDVEVLKTLEGPAIPSGQTIGVYDFGFASDYRGIRFYGTTNVLDPKREYLLFLEPFEYVNTYLSRPIFSYAEVELPAIPIDGIHLLDMTASEEDSRYPDIKESDYFFEENPSEEGLSLFQDQLMRHYRQVGPE